jgi:hypothetical protein
MDFVTDVKVVSSNGDILIEAELINNYMAPQNVSGGVAFQLFRDD